VKVDDLAVTISQFEYVEKARTAFVEATSPDRSTTRLRMRLSHQTFPPEAINEPERQTRPVMVLGR